MQQIQKRALRIIRGNFNLALEECLHECSIHTQNLQYLMVDVYKSLHHLNPEFSYVGIIPTKLFLPKSSYGINSLCFRGSSYSLEIVTIIINIQIKNKNLARGAM